MLEVPPIPSTPMTSFLPIANVHAVYFQVIAIAALYCACDGAQHF